MNVISNATISDVSSTAGFCSIICCLITSNSICFVIGTILIIVPNGKDHGATCTRAVTQLYVFFASAAFLFFGSVAI